MGRLIKEEDGWGIITGLLVIPVLVFLIFAAVQYWGVMTIYQHAEAYKYETLSKMAVKGGLTASDRQELIKKLINLGADPETIKITGSSPTVYHPGEVTLRIEFMPKDFNSFTAKTVINGSPSQGSETVRIGVEGSAISSKTED